MFELTEEQIDEIVLMYGGSKKIIRNIENKINSIGVVENEEDFYEIIIAVIAEKETIKLKLKSCATKKDINNVIISNDDIIEKELNRKYENFEDSSPRIKQKMLVFVNQKNRHN